MSLPTRIEAWRFCRNDVEGAESATFDDASWRTVFVPHDWSIEDVPGTSSPFSATESGGGAGTGHAVGGVGWYRTTLELRPDRRYRLRFDGSYGETDVWLDGVHVATHHYGYTPFDVEVLGGKTVAVAVRVSNLGHNSRWYSGSGLYRPVWLQEVGEVDIAPDGLVVRTVSLEEGSALVEIEARFSGEGQVRFLLLGPAGERVAEPVTATIEAGKATARIRIAKPLRWNPWTSALSVDGDQPIYTVQVLHGADILSEVRFGLKTVEYDAERGLRVNGEQVLLRGGCIHHDHGIIGAAAFDDAEYRKVRLLRDAGFNAVRTSHNPPSVALLDACDRLGILVLDEVHDEWETAKTPDSYHWHFPTEGLEDARAMVRRDRNRACVWCWSIGNEIPDSYDRPDIALHLREAVRSEDSTRPISAGLCGPWWKSEVWKDWETSNEPGFRHLDIGGMNYLWQKVRSDHVAFPERVVMQTETYAFEAWESWRSVVECPWNLGDFVWTAQDYIGESGIGQSFAGPDEPTNGAYPFHLAICGDLDLIGNRKPRSYYRESLWRDGVIYTTVHVPARIARRKIEEIWHWKWGWDEVASHWNWAGYEGEPLTVEVYTSCRRVDLKLNGTSFGCKEMTQDDHNRVRFEIPYEPGTLEAVGWGADGRKVTHSLTTHGPAAKLEAAADRAVVFRPGALGYAMLSVVDEGGVPVVDAQLPIHLDVKGPGALAGFGNACPTDVDSLIDADHRTWEGHALLAIRPLAAGAVIVRATSPGLQPLEFSLEFVG